MTKTEKNQLWSSFFDVSALGNWLWLPVAHFWVKNWTGPDLQTLCTITVCHPCDTITNLRYAISDAQHCLPNANQFNSVHASIILFQVGELNNYCF